MNNKTKLIPRRLIGGLIPKFEKPAGNLRRINSLHGGIYVDESGNMYKKTNTMSGPQYTKLVDKGYDYIYTDLGGRHRVSANGQYSYMEPTEYHSLTDEQIRLKEKENLRNSGLTIRKGRWIVALNDWSYNGQNIKKGDTYLISTKDNSVTIKPKETTKPADTPALANQNSDVKDGNRKSGRISGKVNGNKSTSTLILPTSTPEATYTPTVPKSMEYANDYLTASTPDTASSAYNTLALNVLSDVDKRIAEINPRINSTDPYGEMMNAMKGWDLKRKQKMMNASVGTAWDWNTEEGRKAFTGMAQYLKNGKGNYQKAYDLYLASQNTPKLETLNNNFYANLSNDVKNMKLNLPEFKFTFDPESPTFAQLYTPPQLNLKLNATSNTPFVNYSGPDAWLDDLSWKKDLNSAYNRYLSTFARKGTKLIPRNNQSKSIL